MSLVLELTLLILIFIGSDTNSQKKQDARCA